MSALPSPRIPARTEDPGRRDAYGRAQNKKPGGYFQQKHRWIDDMLWIADGQCEQYCLEKIQSLSNLRDVELMGKDKHPERAQGRTGLLSTTDWAELAEGRFHFRSFQGALDRLTKIGAIRRISYAEVMKAGIPLTPTEARREKEAGKAPRFAFMYEAATENWPAIAEELQAEARAAEEAAREAAQEQETEPDPEVEHVAVGKPLILLPGNRRPFALSPADRKVFSRVEEIECRLDLSFPVKLEFRPDGYSLQLLISEATATGKEINRKKISGKPNPLPEKLLAAPGEVIGEQVAAYRAVIAPQWRRRFGVSVPLTADILAAAVATAACPAAFFESVWVQSTFFSTGYKVVPRLLLTIAADAGEKWKGDVGKEWVREQARHPNDKFGSAAPTATEMPLTTALNFIRAAEAGEQVDDDLLDEARRTLDKESSKC